MSVTVAPDRSTHWVKLNHQNRVPRRWIAFDSESRVTYQDDTEIQTWAMGAAIRWRSDLKTGDHAEARTFDSALELWQWVTEFCKPRQRTCVAAHNLGHDVRITQALEILPQLGWRLEWCNLDRNVSAMTWRSDHGTLILWDTWTWLPIPLATVAPSVGLRKLPMPPDTAKHYRWERYCMRDAEIVYRVVSDLVAFVKVHNLGNWQPTGAGMSYATWRHKFMSHKVLVHDDVDALAAERAAMHTGRAEAWQHGVLDDRLWTEVDMRNAYVTIAAECELPTKIKMVLGSLNDSQYHSLARCYRVLGLCDITTDIPCVPYHNGTRTLWPVGQFTTWLWDTEINLARGAGATVKIRKAYAYTMSPCLRDWATWVLSVLHGSESEASPVCRTWLKHCSRALIGRIALRVTQWQLFGSNPYDQACITHTVDVETGKTSRLMHIGSQTFEETGQVEGRDSLPQITGWIMAECRVRLWLAMCAAGLDHVAHVDTDSLLVDRVGLKRLREAYGDAFVSGWQLKGSRRRVIVYGPRNYRWGRARKVSGVPRKATETLPNVFHGEKWQGVSAALEAGGASSVVVEPGEWKVTASDPRRRDGVGVATLPYVVGQAAGVSPIVSSSAMAGDGA